MKDKTTLPGEDAIAVVVRAIHAHQSAVRVANGEQPFHPFDQNPPKKLAKWAEEARVAIHAYLTQTDEGRTLVRLIETLCGDLNCAHDEIMKLQGADPSRFDWPEWSGPANSIRAAETLLRKRLAKTDAWTMFPSSNVDAIARQEGEGNG